MNMSQESSDASTSQAYKVLHNDQVGRYMVTSRELQAGEELVTEMPFVVGPKACTYPLCLSCYTPWPPEPDDKQLCSTCGWPVCGQECENALQHKDYECQVFAQANEKFNIDAALQNNENGVPQLECITPLRLLLESERNVERWNKEIKDMEPHNKIRCQKAQWKSDHVNIVDYLRKRLKLDRFSEEHIQTVCGILEINTFEVRTAKGFSARGLYPTVAMMNHSCVSNTSHSISPIDYRIRLRTTLKIPAGGELYASYTHSLLPTMLRREHLLEGKHFACACPRCSDPTELGTHMSSLKCNKCDNGIVLSLDSLDSESKWKCTHCDFSTTGQAVRKVFRIIQAEVDAAEAISGADGADAIHERETIMKKYRSVLHPQHAFLSMLRHSLTQMYGRVDEYLLDDLPDVVLEHKVDLCRSLLQVLNVVEPGYSRVRGMTLYELHAPLLFLAKGQWNAGVIDETGLKSKMIEAANILKEAVMILSLEPPDTSEGQIGLVAKESMVQLEQSINDL
ncbi:SET domain-containing protein SmydA-8 [Solenopsis invicta]|uniref:SET domain-containing protein SmydA-8 n=1 Tax=Solenopsis invicta TaxID=13686 RepID=UPI00193D9000|nr:SET domain-containing protein SmydA-8 [Solenopsis invicta]